MNILFVCHRFPYPPTRGGKIRPFNIIRHLHDKGHKVWVASIGRSAEELDAGAGIRDHCQAYVGEWIGNGAAILQMVLRLPVRTPSSMGYFYSRRLRDKIDEILNANRIDLIIAHCSSVAQYVEHVNDIPAILDFGDMDSQKWLMYSKFRAWPLTWGYWYEGKKLEREEKRLSGLFDCCTCTTRAELETLDSYESARSTSWFPNGVDFEYFRPFESAYDPDKICFVGRMDYYPNQKAALEFCAKIFPLIRARRETAEFVIVGASPPAHIRALSSISGVTVTGSVDDVRPYVQNAALTVAPIDIARGTQNKIIESMAMGVPVVSSNAASRGVDAEAGVHILVADTPEGYAGEILRVLGDSEFRQRLADQALHRVRDRHSWAQSMKRLDAIIERTLNASNQG